MDFKSLRKDYKVRLFVGFEYMFCSLEVKVNKIKKCIINIIFCYFFYM